MKDIPLHQLQDRTSSGLHIKRFKIGDPYSDDVPLGAHRDDHYIFFFIEKGTASLMIDFHELHLSAGTIYYILPTQVHHRIRNKDAEGWFIAADTVLIPPDCRDIFESQLLLQQPYVLNETQLNQGRTLLSLVYEKYAENAGDNFHLMIVRTLLHSFMGMAAGFYSSFTGTDNKLSRTAELSTAFKKLLTANIRTIKSPSDYASRLNVSANYLNEVIKSNTGFPASYWIQQEVMIEAKRLLYYSQLNVKEIAHSLGYEDHAYFSRFFKKATGISALAFREQYRK
jgi:AraC family transcriptional regulator, transcriptional activator of pobA